MSDWPTKEECAAFYDAMTNPTKTFWLGVEKERQENRVAAFGAIRRAAEVARWHDSEAASWKALRNDNSEDYEWCADQIRRAIRAAIGSEKA